MLLEGQQLDRYHIVRLLGSGGMGDVYIGQDPHIHQQVAIKVIHLEQGNSETATRTAMNMLLREAKAQAALDHPHILQLFDYGEQRLGERVLLYLVMPYRAEGSLAHWLRQRPNREELLPLATVAHIVQQASEALQHAHDHQIIHQDVKPSNFLLRLRKETPNLPDLLLSDFGIANLSGLTANISQTVRGTPTYMAPEQWQGKPAFATDQYALAVMAYEILTGRPPFQGPPATLMHHHIFNPPPSPSQWNPEISPELEKVLLQALVKDPQGRFPSIAAFSRAFQQAVSNKISGQSQQPSPTEEHNKEDLRAAILITSEEATQGTTRNITLPQGRRITVVIPAGAQAGQRIQITGEGDLNEQNGKRGDLILTCQIQEQTPPAASSNTLPPTALVLRDTPPTPNIVTGNAQWLPVSSPHQTNRPSKLRQSILLIVTLLILGVCIFATLNLYQHYTQPDVTHAATGSPSPTAITTPSLVETAETQSTATALSSLATLTAIHPYPSYLPGQGHLAAYNALDGTDQNPLLNEYSDSDWGGSCKITNGAYHMQQTKNPRSYHCEDFPAFSDAALEVQMTILKGNCGGIFFHATSDDAQDYSFEVCQNGSYDLFIYSDHSVTRSLIKNATSTAIHGGTNKPNTLAVITQEDTILLYANHQLLKTVRDQTYQYDGYFGFIADDSGQATDVAYNNIAVWTF